MLYAEFRSQGVTDGALCSEIGISALREVANRQFVLPVECDGPILAVVDGLLPLLQDLSWHRLGRLRPQPCRLRPKREYRMVNVPNKVEHLRSAVDTSAYF
jgi:hypothetical protein